MCPRTVSQCPEKRTILRDRGSREASCPKNRCLFVRLNIRDYVLSHVKVISFNTLEMFSLNAGVGSLHFTVFRRYFRQVLMDSSISAVSDNVLHTTEATKFS